ncbi:hypothetical protein GGI23_006552, partial [Coemansia sp. RSA 2559]
AELVWRSGHQSIDDKFPHFRGKATVSLPKSLSVITDSVHRGLYAHMFIQEASNVPSQNPDLEDPLLIHSVQPIVWWEPQEIDDTFRFISGHGHPHPSSNRKSNADYQLVAAQSASWGMSLESNAVKMVNAVGCKGNRWLANDVSTSLFMMFESNPVLFKNLITRSMSGVDVLLAHRNDGSLPKSVDVDIDLQGIKGYIIAIKATMLKMTSQKFMTCPRLTPMSDGIHGVEFRYKKGLSEIPDSFSRYIYDHSVRTILSSMFVLVALISLTIITLKVDIAYWLGPKSKWIGMSRASFALCLADPLITLLRKNFTNEDPYTTVDTVELVIGLYVLLLLLGRSLNPLIWLRAVARVVKHGRSERTYANVLPTQLDLKPEWKTTEDVYGSEKPAHESGLSPGQVARTVAAREKVDKTALQASRSIIVVLLAVFSLYSLYEHGFNPFSADYIDDVLYYMQLMAVSLRYVPQLAVNYRTRSATHTPVIEHFNSIVTALGGTLLCRYTGIDIWGEMSVHALPTLACSAIALVQYFMYFKEKKD